MSTFKHASIACLILFITGGVGAQQSDNEQLRQQVKDTETAFASSMANRDFQAFASFLSDEAVFFSGESALRGSQQVADTWKAYFEEPSAPFSWEAQRVEVLDSGTLALSTGPVFDSGGNRIATFSSIWRLEAPGEWRIIFDKGNRFCDGPQAEPSEE